MAMPCADGKPLSASGLWKGLRFNDHGFR